MKRLSINFASILLSDIGRRLLGFLSVAYLARTIGVEGFGMVSVGLTVLSYSLMVSALGLNTFGIREVARGLRGDDVSKLISVRFVNAIIAFAIVTAVCLLFIQNKEFALVIVVISAAVLPGAVILDWYFQGREQMGAIGIARFGSAFIYLLVLITFVHSPSDLLWVGVAGIVGDTLASLWMWKRFAREERFRFQLSMSSWKSTMAAAFPLGAGSMLAHFSINLPLIVLSILMTNTDVGIYSAANKLVFFLLVLDRVMATLLLPTSSRLQALGVDRLVSALEITLKWIFILALPVAVGGTILAKSIVVLVFGPAFHLTASTLQILIWYFVLTMILTIYTSGVIACGKEKRYGNILFISTIIYVPLLLLGTLTFGVIGAAISIVVFEGVTVLLMRRELHTIAKIPFPKPIFPILLATALMGCIVWLLPDFHVVVSVLVGGIVYIVALFITGGITRAEIKYLLQKI